MLNPRGGRSALKTRSPVALLPLWPGMLAVAALTGVTWRQKLFYTILNVHRLYQVKRVVSGEHEGVGTDFLM